MLGPGTKQRAPWEGRVELGQRIVAVDASQPPCVELTFADGYQATLNFQHFLDVGKVFEPLRDAEFFKTAHPGSHGSSLEWVTADGSEIDMCADSLRMQAEGIWDPITQEWKE